MPSHPDRLTTAEAAEYLPMPVDTLRWRRKQGLAPRSFKIGRKLFYEKTDLDAFLDQQRETTGVGGST